jgi:hypothetical protein
VRRKVVFVYRVYTNIFLFIFDINKKQMSIPDHEVTTAETKETKAELKLEETKEVKALDEEEDEEEEKKYQVDDNEKDEHIWKQHKTEILELEKEVLQTDQKFTDDQKDFIAHCLIGDNCACLGPGGTVRR